MKITHLSYPHQLKRDQLPETSAAIGFFDGIHRGHQQVIQKAVDDAAISGREAAVITFYPHPSVVLRPDVENISYITPPAEKEAILEGMGIDRLYVIEFNKALSSVSPAEFVDHFLVELNIRHIVAGFDFSFGHKGKGNMENLEQYANGRFTFSTVEKVKESGEKISSTRIRHLLMEGRVEETNQLLGRPLSLTGRVVEGDKRGRTIGYPTANLEVSQDYLLPRTGVYAVTAEVNSRKWKGMANLGYKPTFQEKADKPSVEVNLFDFDEDIYGETVRLEWLVFIREEKKFNGVEELIENIKNDEQQIRSLLSRNSGQ